LRAYGYEELQESGFRVVFRNEVIKHNIEIHRPHPDNVMKRYQIDLILQELKTKNLI
jgi:hypothetical protein